MESRPPTAGALKALRGEAMPEALITLYRAEAMGLVSNARLDLRASFGALLTALEGERVVAPYVLRVRQAIAAPDAQPAWMKREIRSLYEALGRYSAPRQEARALVPIFGADQLAELLLDSRENVVLYARGERQAPHAVAARLHWLALTVGNLTSTYNEYGMRRWFQRPRHELQGFSPREVLLAAGEWTPDSKAAQSLERLAVLILGMVAT